MILRPVDASGDILPVLYSAALLRGAPAVARLMKDRLELLSGEWWENPGIGFGILELLRSSRLTQDSASSLASFITAYIRETEGVLAVEDVAFSVSGRQFNYACTVRTEEGPAAVTTTLAV